MIQEQWVDVLAINQDTLEPEPGVAESITATVVIGDGAAQAADDEHPSELDASNLPGVYRLYLGEAEREAEQLLIGLSCSVTGVLLDPTVICLAARPSVEDVHLIRQCNAGKHTHDLAAKLERVFDRDGVTVLMERTITDVNGLLAATPVEE